MPSPFPGMDPYLEAPDIWPDFHHAFATEIRNALNRTMPQPYYARLEMRPEIGIVEEESSRPIVPDVAIVRTPRTKDAADREGGTALLDAPRARVSNSISVRTHDEILQHHFVEIRDASRGHALVTLIEIVSPTNKRSGEDRRAYEKKQRETLGSDTSLMEIDLLRRGESVVAVPAVRASAARSRPAPRLPGDDQSRLAAQCADLEYQVFPVRLEGPLPCIPVPLREGEGEPLLDLQFIFQLAYDGGPYARGAVDYEAPPEPPVRDDLKQWLNDCLEKWWGPQAGDRDPVRES